MDGLPVAVLRSTSVVHSLCSNINIKCCEWMAGKTWMHFHAYRECLLGMPCHAMPPSSILRKGGGRRPFKKPVNMQYIAAKTQDKEAYPEVVSHSMPRTLKRACLQKPCKGP